MTFQGGPSHLSNKEADTFVVDADVLLDKEEQDFLLIGKIFCLKMAAIPSLKTSLKLSWGIQNEFHIRDMGKNIFMFNFVTLQDKLKVLSGGPWWFDRRLLLVKETDLELGPEETSFRFQAFWIQLHNLPIGCLNEKFGWALGKRIGEEAQPLIDLGRSNLGTPRTESNLPENLATPKKGFKWKKAARFPKENGDDNKDKKTSEISKSSLAPDTQKLGLLFEIHPVMHSAADQLPLLLPSSSALNLPPSLSANDYIFKALLCITTSKL
ncbi:hypothetical protein ACFE04_002216 [Oxalis oulophora]